MSATAADHVRWHDLECGRYRADLGVWLSLAERVDGPVLDLGCGTGRVALHLARAGRTVTAVDLDAGLLEAVSERAAGLALRTVQSDITDLAELGSERWPLVLLPMQTIQLLPDSGGRRAMFRAVRAHMQVGGLFAAAIVTTFETFDAESGTPAPDMERIEGDLFVSRPIAVRAQGETITVERERWIGRSDGPVAACGHDVVRLQRVSSAQLTVEADDGGFEPVELIPVAETADHVANEVVVFRAR